MSVLYGKAAVFGVNGSIWAYGLASVAINSTTFTDNFNSQFLIDKDGGVVGSKVSNRSGQCTMTYTPYSTTFSGVRAVISMPEPYALIRLSGFEGNVNGDWNYTGGGEIILTTAAYSVHRLNLVRFTSISPKQLSTIKFQS
jgi:hypothetical protein